MHDHGPEQEGTPDTTDGVMMLGAYGWPFVKPMRRLYYNMTITLVSIIVALLIGGIETLGLIGNQFGLKGTFWNGIGALNDNFNYLGFAIIGVFALVWIVSYAIYRASITSTRVGQARFTVQTCSR